MKRFLKWMTITLSFVMLLGMCGISVLAAETKKDGVSVTVTIADGAGKLVLIQEEIRVTDTDGDGKLTINDALYAAHEEKYTGGAAAGYTAVPTEFGLSMTKLWGAENGSGYGYYRNNQSAFSLADTVTDGDSVSAFVYTDTVNWSDTYCFFDKNTVKSTKGETVTLTLFAAGFDEEFQPINVPVEGAVITFDGTATEYRTDKDGTVTFPIDKTDSFIVSATSDTSTLVPPVCKIAVVIPPDTGDNGTVYLFLILAAVACVGIIVLRLGKKKKK